MAYGEPDAIHPADYYGSEGMRSMGERMRESERFIANYDHHEHCRDLAVQRSKRRKQEAVAKQKRKGQHQPPGEGKAGSTRNWHNRRRRVFERDGYRCVTCGTEKNLTLDHIRPRLFGGSGNVANLQTMCGPCNSEKGNAWDGKSGHPSFRETAVAQREAA